MTAKKLWKVAAQVIALDTLSPDVLIGNSPIPQRIVDNLEGCVRAYGIRGARREAEDMFRDMYEGVLYVDFYNTHLADKSQKKVYISPSSILPLRN